MGLWGVFCLGAGVMISSWLFVLPGLVYESAGPAVVLAYALAALMAIAHCVQEPDFFRRWLNASSADHLRDILLLSGRTRDKSTQE